MWRVVLFLRYRIVYIRIYIFRIGKSDSACNPFLYLFLLYPLAKNSFSQKGMMSMKKKTLTLLWWLLLIFLYKLVGHRLDRENSSKFFLRDMSINYRYSRVVVKSVIQVTSLLQESASRFVYFRLKLKNIFKTKISKP